MVGFTVDAVFDGKEAVRRWTGEAEVVRVARRDDGAGGQYPFNVKGLRGGLPVDVFGRRTGRGSAEDFSADAAPDGKGSCAPPDGRSGGCTRRSAR